MNQQKTDECPEPKILVQFLQGKLQPPQLDRCEVHVKDCTVCHDTLVGLSLDDTLTERMADVFRHEQTDEFSLPVGDESQPSPQIENLLERLTSDDFKRSAMAERKNGEAVSRSPEMEIMADRAAEVLRCVKPAEDSLGVLGDYLLIRLIGAGSTGVVFEAIDQPLERTVALKVLRPSLGEVARNRFVVEAKLAASIEHENVVTIFQVGQLDRLAYMAMSWIPGQTLEAKLASGKPISDDEVVKIVRQVAAGLGAAHQKQLVHRDIKPANLWICEEGRQIKILDFGLARINDENPNLTATGMLAGTPGFMSPEQSRGLELDGRSDLFSLGCVMYRLLTGKVPFGAPTVLATLTSIQNDHPAPPVSVDKDVDPNLSDLTMCLLEKHASNRPESAAQMIEMLSTDRQQWPILVPRYANNNLADRRDAKQPVKRVTNFWNQRSETLLTAAISLLLLGIFGWMIAYQVVRVQTDRGEVVIETTDKDVEIQVLKNGNVIEVIDTETKQSFSLKSGQYSFNAIPKEGSKENSFTINPSKLTMRRGKTAVVSVTLVPKTEAKDATGSEQPNRTMAKAFYKGETFDHWIQTAQFDRDVPTKTQALKACAAIAETLQEETQLLELTRTLARTHGANMFGSETYVDMYHDAFMSVLSSVSDDQVIDFIKTEIAEGTLNSRRFCYSWINVVTPSSPISEAQQKRRGRIQMRAAEFSDVVADNLIKPGVIELADSLLPITFHILPENAKVEKVFEELRSSRLRAVIEKIVKTAPLHWRYKISNFALRIFPDDLEVFGVYHKDLFNPQLDDAEIAKPESEYFGGQGFDNLESWSVVKVRLLKTMLGSLAPTANWNGEYPKPASETEAQRLAAAAKLLAEVVDAIRPDAKCKLLLKRVTRNPPPGFRLPPTPPEALRPDQVGSFLLQTFYNIAQRSKDQDLKRSVIKTLERLIEVLGPEASETEPKLYGGDRAPLLDDIAYVMETLKGVPKTLPPKNTRLQMDGPQITTTEPALPAVAKKDVRFETPIAPITPENGHDMGMIEVELSTLESASPEVPGASETEKEKPLYQGKTFAHWIKIARLDRDLKVWAEAFKACLLTAESRDERQQMLELIRPVVREGRGDKHTIMFNGNTEQHKSVQRLLAACDGNQVFDFVKEEITDGTLESRQFSYDWLEKIYQVYDENIIFFSDEKIDQIYKRVPEIIDGVAEKLEEPVTIKIATMLIAYRFESESDLKKLQGSSLAKKLSKLIRSGDPAFRLKLAALALMLFPGDDEVWQLYENDLLNSKLNKQVVKISKKQFAEIGVDAYYRRLDLLEIMLNFIVYPEDYILQEVRRKELEGKRMASASQLLQKVTDGYLKQSDQSLVFAFGWVNSDTGGYELKPFALTQMTRTLMPAIKSVAKYITEQNELDDGQRKMKKMLRATLSKLKRSIEQQTDKSKSAKERAIEQLAEIEKVLSMIGDDAEPKLEE